MDIVENIFLKLKLLKSYLGLPMSKNILNNKFIILYFMSDMLDIIYKILIK